MGLLAKVLNVQMGWRRDAGIDKMTMYLPKTMLFYSCVFVFIRGSND